MKRFLYLLLLFFIYNILLINPVSAIVDPLAVANNRFGIHVIQATPDESSPAAELVNTNGDWGYVTVLIQSTDRNHDKWQDFFNDLRRRHLIPLVRLATQPEGSYWKRPYEKEEDAWADFLDGLNWPTKNRYVIIYNEPNHGKEWGNRVEARSYAKVLDRVIAKLKNKNRDFFVLNAGFDASAPSKPPELEDELNFLEQMEETVPGIFKKLDGWVSHSYPNPGFVGSPDGTGRGTVRTWMWELQQLQNFGVTRDLPVFITETGWRHAEGITYDSMLPAAEIVAGFFRQAFLNAWNSEKIAAVTPFLLSYQENPFDHFSFKKITGERQKEKILGIEYPEYYPMYQAIKDMPKIAGDPIQENKAELTKGEVYSSVVSGQNYVISLTFKNTGQSIWNDPKGNFKQVKLVAMEGTREFGMTSVEIPKEIQVEPGKEYTFQMGLKAPQNGTFKVVLNLNNGRKQFDSDNLEFTTVVKSPVILKIKGGLAWKRDFSGNYILSIKGATGQKSQNITLDKNGLSPGMEVRYLLPDYSFDFILEKAFYKPANLKQTLNAGVNILDFGILQPDLLSAVLSPVQLWNLLPFSK